MSLAIKAYLKAKAAGTTTVAKLLDDIAVVSVPRFSPDDGQPADPQIEQFSIKNLKEQLKTMEGDVADLKAFIADLEGSPKIGLNRVPPAA